MKTLFHAFRFMLFKFRLNVPKTILEVANFRMHVKHEPVQLGNELKSFQMENASLQCSSLVWDGYPSRVRKETMRFYLEIVDATLVSDLFDVKKGSALTPPKTNTLLKNDGWNTAFLLEWSLVRRQVDFRGSQYYACFELCTCFF